MISSDWNLHSLFQRCAERTPEREALVWAHGRLSYRELNLRANRLARYLLASAIGRHARVGVALPRSEHLVVSLLAVLKAGACYVPLDPGYPIERLAFMLEDADCALLIADAATGAKLRQHGCCCPQLMPDAASAEADVVEDPDSGVSGHDLAYVIYTSGSTGQPKGVAIEHRSAVALMVWAQRTFTAQELSGMMACTSICFDLSVFELFAPLCSGGCVLLVESALALANSPLRERVRVVNTVPSAMRELLRIDGVPAGVTTVCLAGEAFRADLARALGRQPGIRRVINAYGPTEDTTYSTWAELDPQATSPPPIGRPLPGRYLRILDDALAPCPPGEPGELFLGGIGLARGYLNRPELTAERFICDPYDDAADARLYRTGDRVRLREDGQLEYIGRLDSQVKLRGYRIELGEIERVLGDQNGVVECAVIVAPGPSDDPRLVAYYTGNAAHEALRNALEAALPAFMVPAALVALRTMPHTMNGKCDRKRLPAPEWRAPPHPAAETEAATGSASPFEALVTAVWRDALGLASIARDRSFLSLGGHSLLATRVIARLREATGKALSLAEFFEQPTIAGCAQQLAIAPVAAGAITRILAGEEAPLTAAQKQMWFMARLDPDDTSYNQPCLIRIAGGIEPERLRRALASVICAQPALRIRIVERDGESAQRVAAEVELDLPCIEFDAVDLDAALRAQGLLLAAAPFALDTAPLLRAQLCKVGEEDWVLLLVVHHLVFDEWSLSILVQQLAAAYVEEREPATPALRFIDDCADRQGRDWSDALDALEREFADVPPSLALPTDRPRGLHLDTAGGGLNVVLDEALSRSLSALAADAGVTEYMLLLAVFQLLLHETSGQSCFLTLTAASGRDAVGSEEVIGCYINMVPLRADVVAGERFPELLARVRSRCLAALERQRLPLEQLVARLPRTPGLPQSAFGQVAFGLQNAPSAEAQVAGIRFSGCEIRNVAARLDLSVWIDVRSGPLRVEWTYRNDLFEPSTIAGLQQRYRELLQAVAASPESDVAALLRNGKQGFIDTNAPGKPLPSKLSAKLVPKTFGRRDSASLERDWLGQALPSRVVATLDGVDVAEWAAAHRPLIDEQLSTVGGLLMRGFRVDSVNDFRAFAQAVSSELIHYSERSSPRTEVTDGIYTSTDHPQDQPIVLHNEQSYTLNWPMRIGFYCARPALQRGRTPIADSRRILARLAPATVERFERLGVMYVRNFHDGISLPWTVAFQTDDRRQVEAYCRSVSVDVEWIDGDRLRTRQVRPAIRVHPCIDERTWFNHALFFHVTSLPEEITRSLRASMAEEHLPYNTYYGDGSPIADETLAELRAAFDAETVSFNWRRGDVLLLDNMLVAHGREPFVGPREVRAVMLDPYLSLRAASPLPAQAKERPA